MHALLLLHCCLAYPYSSRRCCSSCSSRQHITFRNTRATQHTCRASTCSRPSNNSCYARRRPAQQTQQQQQLWAGSCRGMCCCCRSGHCTAAAQAVCITQRVAGACRQLGSAAAAAARQHRHIWLGKERLRCVVDTDTVLSGAVLQKQCVLS